MQVTATVRTHAGGEGSRVETREFSALASGLALLVQWLLGLRVSGAVMEATGVYWEKVYDILSDAGLDVMVVNAQHVKQIKGRKTDIADSLRLSRICQFGLGSPSLVLPKSFRDLRGLSRYRRTLIEQRARTQLRIQKVLDRGGVRIGGVLSRITHGVNGRRILEGIIAGEACEDILGGLSWHVRKKLDLLGDALSVELDAHSRWILGDLLTRFDSDTVRIEAADRQMEAALAPYEAQVRLLETLPGVSRESAMAILVELGPDMSVFASARHCAAWTGICPGNNESAGKRRSGRIRRGNPVLRAILVECAHAAVSGRALARAPQVTFPAPPLKFRTSGFPGYGFKHQAPQWSSVRCLPRHPPRLRLTQPCPWQIPAFAPPFGSTAPPFALDGILGRRRALCPAMTCHLRHLGPEALAPDGLCCPAHHRLIGLIRQSGGLRTISRIPVIGAVLDI